MKITLVCDILGEENNGTTVATMNLVRYLQKKHEVKILCCDPKKKGLPNYYVTRRKKFPGALNTFVISTGFALAKPEKKIIEEAVKGADIVHCFEPFALSMKAIKIAKKNNIPTTAAVHLLPEHLLYYVHMHKLHLVNWLIYKYWWNHTYSKVDAIHFPTQFDKNLFSRFNRRTSKKKTYVISNGVSKQVYKKHVNRPTKFKDKFVVLCCGRYSPEKAQDTLMKAMKFSKYADKIQLIFAGQGQREKAYKKLAAKLNIKPIFKRYKHDELIDLINYCDLIVHPAILETEGISVLEAMTCGKLIIVSDAKKSAPRTFGLDDECVFKAKNPKSLAEKIDYWLSNPTLRQEYSLKNFERAKNFDIDICLAETEKMLIETVKNHKQKK